MGCAGTSVLKVIEINKLNINETNLNYSQIVLQFSHFYSRLCIFIFFHNLWRFGGGGWIWVGLGSLGSLWWNIKKGFSSSGTRTRALRVRAAYPNHLDQRGLVHYPLPPCALCIYKIKQINQLNSSCCSSRKCKPPKTHFTPSCGAWNSSQL